MISKIKLCFSSLLNDHFSQDDNIFKRNVFNALTVFLFASIVLIMGFTRIFPLNYLLKFLIFITNILIVLYVLLFAKVRIDKFFILLLFAVIWFSFIALITKSINESQTLILNFLNIIPIYLILTNSQKARKTFFGAVVVGLLIYTFSFTGYYFKDILSFNLSNRLGSFFGNQNDVAATLLIASTIFFYYFIRGKYYYVIPFVFAIVNLLSTGSRAGLLNLSIVLFAMFFLAFYRKNKKILLLGLSIGIILTLGIIFAPFFAPIREGLFNMIDVLFKGNLDADSSTMSRYNVIFESIYLFLLSPLFGNFISLTQFTANEMVAHNAFLEISASQGVISLLIFSAAFFYPLIKVIKSDHKHRLLFGSVIAGSILFHFTLTSIPFKEQYMILALSMAYVSTSFIDFDISAETIKLKLLRRIRYLDDKEYYKEIDVLINNILFSKQQLVFLSPQYTDSNRLITNLLEKGLTCKALSLHDCSIDTIDKNSLYIVNNFDSKKDEHLKLLNKILQETSYKVIVINDEPIYQNGIFSRSTYASLFTINYNKKKCKSKRTTTPVINIKSKSIERNYIINTLFSSIFAFLSISSLHFANSETNLGSKIILIFFASMFYFRITTIIYHNEHINYSWQKKALFYILGSLLPISLFALSTFIEPLNIVLTPTMTIYMAYFAISTFIPVVIKS